MNIRTKMEKEGTGMNKPFLKKKKLGKTQKTADENCCKTSSTK